MRLTKGIKMDVLAELRGLILIDHIYDKCTLTTSLCLQMNQLHRRKIDVRIYPRLVLKIRFMIQPDRFDRQVTVIQYTD